MKKFGTFDFFSEICSGDELKYLQRFKYLLIFLYRITTSLQEISRAICNTKVGTL